jgi:predicted RNA-binding Zn-ribbon protein involved in translation (DUF1610 family)
VAEQWAAAAEYNITGSFRAAPLRMKALNAIRSRLIEGLSGLRPPSIPEPKLCRRLEISGSRLRPREPAIYRTSEGKSWCKKSAVAQKRTSVSRLSLQVSESQLMFLCCACGETLITRLAASAATAQKCVWDQFVIAH